MDKCFVACGCDDYGGVTKSDLDRFTDKIENVLNDEKGRKLFRDFMYTCKMKSGRTALNFWEHVEILINYKETTESMPYRSYLEDIDNLIDEADRISTLDFATMERLTIARDSENREEIVEALRGLKVETTKAFRREYTAFREHFLKMKTP